MCKFSGIFVSAVPVQNPAGFYKGNIMNVERSNFNSLVKKIVSKHWQPLKRNVVPSSKEVLWVDFEQKKMFSGTSLARSEGQKVLYWFEGDDVLRLRSAMSGTKLERAVSPECNEIVASKRNLKNECKNLERHTLQRLQLCTRRLDKCHGKIIFLRCIW